MRDFETIYEYSYKGSDLWHIFPILMFAALGFGIVFFVKRYFSGSSLFRQILLFIAWGIGCIASIIFIVFLVKTPSILREERELKYMIEHKTYFKVEGVVEDFKPAQESPNHFESFSVNGIHFRYSDFVIIDGFHNTSKNNGPIKGNGQVVRIGYSSIDDENTILKLEVIQK